MSDNTNDGQSALKKSLKIMSETCRKMKIKYIFISVIINKNVQPLKEEEMRNSELCTMFVNGSRNNAHTLSMRISCDGSRLFSYSTCIAQKLPNGAIIINDTKYSPTTSKHQCYLRCAIPKGLQTYHTTQVVRMGTYDLSPYYKR